MSTPIFASIAQRQSPKPELIRKTAGFHPSVWGDHFLNYTPKEKEDTMTHARIKELKKDVTRELMAAAAAAASEPSSSPRQLNLIDAIQRLGVSYHFETEIEQALQHICQRYHNYDEDDSLYSVALRFRLLRQEGFDVSSDVFNKFKDGKGNFKESLIGDMMGMLCLYEATHLLKHGENILEEAMTFTTTHLVSSMATTTNFCNSLTPPQVMYALEQPIRKGLPRLEARHYIPIYEHEQDGSHNQALLDLAKLDFNHLQSLHKKELCNITRWWKDLDFATKLPYARDRVVEGYFWILGVYFEPQYSLARTILTKVIAMTSVIDDTYDVYGTFEELQLFTEAIRRWNMSSIDELPEYMKLCYKALLDVYEKIEEEMCKRGGQSYRTHYAIQAIFGATIS